MTGRRDDLPAFDVLGQGWRIAWRGPRIGHRENDERNLPAHDQTERVMARVVDAQIGHRTLKPFDDTPIRFRYLLRLEVIFSFQGKRITATPITWQHEFESHDAAHSYCANQLGFIIPEKPPTDADLEHQRRGQPGTEFELTVHREQPQMCWIDPDPPSRRLTPNFDIVISMSDQELAAYKRKEKNSSPILLGIKVAILIGVFIWLWMTYG